MRSPPPERRVVYIDEVGSVLDPDGSAPGVQQGPPAETEPDPEPVATESEGRKRRWRLFRKGGDS